MTVGLGTTAVLSLVAVTVRFWTWPPPAVMFVRLIDWMPAFWRTAPGVVTLTVGATLIGIRLIVRDDVPEPGLVPPEPSKTVNVTVRGSVDGLVLPLKYVTERIADW